MFHPETAYELAKERQRRLEEAASDGRRARKRVAVWRWKAGPLAALRSARSST